MTARILYDDAGLVVLDKPPGIAVLPTRAGDRSVAGETGLRPCHRLDAETSGCLVLARSVATERIVAGAFAEGRVHKEYAAVVVGTLDDEGECALPIGAWRRGRVSVGEGRSARTRWTVRWRREDRIGVLVFPLTGRTHQIRAHLAALGAPILGDDTYGGPVATRVHLHAWRVQLPWSGSTLSIEAPLPFGFDPS